jgi:hypothetical protein
MLTPAGPAVRQLTAALHRVGFIEIINPQIEMRRQPFIEAYPVSGEEPAAGNRLPEVAQVPRSHDWIVPASTAAA